MIKKLMYLFMLLPLTACSGQARTVSDDFIVHAFKVGKADSLLISHQGEYVLIDTGEEDDGEKILRYLQSNNINKLKALVITHYDKDHVGGADYLVNALDIEHVYVPNYESDSKQTREFLHAIDNKQLVLEKITGISELTVGEVKGEMYPTMQTMEGDSFLFAGDIEAPRIAELLMDTAIRLPHTFLKVPYHGRFNEQTTALIEEVRPMYALITSSDKNPEHDETVGALEAVKAQIFTTRKGDMEFYSDGEEITVREK